MTGMGRRGMRGYGEHDAFSRWARRWYASLQRAGVRKEVKRQVHRRERREAKQEIRRGES